VVDECEAHAFRRTPCEPRRGSVVVPKCHGGQSGGENRRMRSDCIRTRLSQSLRLQREQDRPLRRRSREEDTRDGDDQHGEREPVAERTAV
jgi:hypothetical protein